MEYISKPTPAFRSGDHQRMLALFYARFMIASYASSDGCGSIVVALHEKCRFGLPFSSSASIKNGSMPFS